MIKSNRFSFIYLVLVFLFLSCNENDLEQLDNSFKKLNISLADKETFYVFYGQSCSSCMEQVVKFVQHKLSDKSDRTYFIFTDMRSVKEVDHIYGDISYHPRVIIDLEQRFYSLKYSEEIKFPIKVQLDNEKIKNVESLDLDYFTKVLIN